MAPKNLSTSFSLNSSVQNTSLLPSCSFDNLGETGWKHALPTEEVDVSTSEDEREVRSEGRREDEERTR